MAGLMDYLLQGPSEDNLAYERQASLMDDPYAQAQQLVAPTPAPAVALEQEASPMMVEQMMSQGQGVMGGPYREQSIMTPSATPKMDNAITQMAVATQPEAYKQAYDAQMQRLTQRPKNDDPLIQRLAMNFFAPKTYAQDQRQLEGEQALWDTQLAAQQKVQQAARMNQAYSNPNVLGDDATVNPEINDALLAAKLKPKPKVSYSAGYKAARDMGLEPGSEAFNTYADKINNKSMVTINNSQSDKYNPGTAEQNVKWGFRPEEPTHWVKGELKRNVPLTSADAKNKTFMQGMVNAENNITKLKTDYPDFNAADATGGILRLAAADGEGLISKGAQALMSPANKAYYNSSKEWVASNRGFTSGAAVPEVEVVRDMGTYFDQPNDSPYIQAQRAQMRRDRTSAIAATMGMTEAERKRVLSDSAENDAKLIREALKKEGDPVVFNIKDLSKKEKTRYDNLPAADRPIYRKWVEAGRP